MGNSETTDIIDKKTVEHCIYGKRILNAEEARELLDKYSTVVASVEQWLDNPENKGQICDRIVSYIVDDDIVAAKRIGYHMGYIYAFEFKNSGTFTMFEYNNRYFPETMRVLKLFHEQFKNEESTISKRRLIIKTLTENDSCITRTNIIWVISCQLEKPSIIGLI